MKINPNHRSGNADESPPSRREFLAQTAAAVSAAAAGSVAFADPKSQPRQRHNRNAPEIYRSDLSTTIVIAQDEHLIPARIVQRSLLRTHVDRMISSLIGVSDAGAAWNQVLKPDDRILIKFNQSMATLMGTNEPMAAVLVGSLKDAGFSPDRITLLEVPAAVQIETRTRRPDGRWQGAKVVFGESGSDCFLSDLDWATAVINVPFLKTHHRAVMTGCLKNLSHGLIRHPSRFHDRGCDPAIGEINAASDLRDRVKLNIINGLRVACDRGPDASESDLVTDGLLIAGLDAVACDAIGFRELNRVRAMRNLRPLLAGPTLPRQIVSASRLGVGIADFERIKMVRRVGIE